MTAMIAGRRLRVIFIFRFLKRREICWRRKLYFCVAKVSLMLCDHSIFFLAGIIDVPSVFHIFYCMPATLDGHYCGLTPECTKLARVEHINIVVCHSRILFFAVCVFLHCFASLSPSVSLSDEEEGVSGLL